MSAKIIAIDYDGTIALDSFPQAGTPNWPVINRAKEEQMNGAILILWTCRTDKDLEVALAACSEWGLRFDVINDNLPERQAIWGNNTRKIYADEYWDDHAVNKLPGHWIKNVVLQTDTSILYEYTCSECTIISDQTSNYCPNCGAQML